MNWGSGWIKVLAGGFLVVAFLWGCRPMIRPAQEPQGIQYQIVEGAEISKLSLYMKPAEGVSRCWVDVTIKNLRATSERFKVIVQVDDEPEMAVASKKPIDPKKEETITVMTLSRIMPRMISITVTQ